MGRGVVRPVRPPPRSSEPPPPDGPCPGAPLLPSHLCGDPAHAPCAARVGLMHIGVFILLLLSGERNFGVRLNKPYSVRVPMDIPVFTGTHADLLIVVRGPPGACGGAELGDRGDPMAALCSPRRCSTRSSPAGTSGCSRSSTACSPSWSTVGAPRNPPPPPRSPPGGARPQADLPAAPGFKPWSRGNARAAAWVPGSSLVATGEGKGSNRWQ